MLQACADNSGNSNLNALTNQIAPAETYEIKLNKKQIDEIGRKRFVELTSSQSRIIKNKISRFHIDGPKAIIPEGWFKAKWIRPDTIAIDKYLIDRFDSVIIRAGDFEKETNQKNIYINIDLNGKMYYRNKEFDEKNLIEIISKIQKQSDLRSMSVYIANAPYDDKKTEAGVQNKVSAIKDYCDKNSIYFQDDF